MGLLGDLAKGLNFVMGVLDEYLALLLVLYAWESLNIQYFPLGYFLLSITSPMVV